MRCCVPFCKNTSDIVSTSEGRREGISFHGFPSEVHLRAAWLRALGKQDSHLQDSAVVCSQHFLNDDIYETECGFRQIVTGAIPSTVQVCMICLDTDSKLILMSKHKLEETYEMLMGHPLCDQGNLKQTLCVQCAQRLINLSRFRDKSLRARALMMDLVEKYELITLRHIKMINRTKHQLKSSMVLTTLGPDHCDLHILEHPSEDKLTELEEIELRDAVKTEETDDSMLVDGEMEVKHEEDNYVNDFVQDPLKYESAQLQCTLCLEEFVLEHEYMQHIMSVHLQNGEGDGGCDTSQVCKPHTAVSSSSSHSSLITGNKSVEPQATVAPVSATFATNSEKNETKEVDAETNFKQNLGGLQNISVDTKIFTSVVRLCDIFKEFKAPRQDQALTKTRKSVSGIQNIAFIDFIHQATSPNEVPTTEYIDPVTSSRSRVKVTVSKTLQSKTDDINNIQCNNSSQYSSHTAKSSFICDICGNFCNQKCLLVKHIKTHTEKRRFTCKICQQKCKFKSELARHMKTHTRENPFTCTICNSKFARSSHLVCHMRTHTGIKPYACELCEYRSANKSYLKIHMRTHSGIKPYACELCEYKSANKCNLTVHMSTHTEIKLYVCELCEYKTANKSNLVRHTRTHTGEKPYSCQKCEYKYADKRSLLMHMTTHTVVPVSATFATNNENKVHTTKEAGAEQKVKQKLGGLQNTSIVSTIFTNCEVRLCDIFQKPKALRQDQALTKTRKSVSGIQNIAAIDCSHQATSHNEVPTTEYIEPVTNSRSRVKVSVSKSSLSKTDDDDINKIQCNKSSQYSFHTAKSSFICDICGNNYERKSLLVIHLKTHSEVRRFTCKICQYKCKRKSVLARHMRTHTGEKPFTCSICNSKFAESSVLQRHMRTHTGIKPYACELCKYKFARKSNLVSHMRTHTGDKPHSCAICEYKCSEKGSLKKHMITHTGEKPFTCNVCNSKFARCSHLNRHMRTHTGIKPYACELCKYKFARKSNLVSHMRTHTGEKPHSCAICEYKCSEKGSLNKHMITHTGEKPFTCKICNNKFAQNSHLVCHVRTHTGIKPNTCELCEYKCARKSDLVIHMRTHTGEKPYSCMICAYKCSIKSSLSKHMKTHTDKEPFRYL